jgi:hypothetical protein
MEEFLTFELIKGAYIPTLGAMILLAGYFVTDKLFLHDTILLLQGRKAWAVALASFPLAVGYVVMGASYESVLITYFATNGLYDHLIKSLKNLTT